MKQKFIINKLIHIVLLFIFISHLTFAHELISEYVLCTGTDGHIAIEKLDDCSECNEVNYLSNTNGAEIKQQACEDVSLDENCFEEDQFLTKNKITFSAKFASISFITFKTFVRTNSYTSDKPFQLSDQILESYTTVSLII